LQIIWPCGLRRNRVESGDFDGFRKESDMSKTGVVTDPLYIKHDPGMGHPESPDRLRAIYSLIEKEGIMKKCAIVTASELFDLIARLAPSRVSTMNVTRSLYESLSPPQV